MKNPVNAAVVANALTFFANQRYILDAWVIMPNHVHVLVKPINGFNLWEITHSWKSFSATKINELENREGQLWMHESHYHIVRSAEALDSIRDYIGLNPQKAGLQEGTFLLS
ncbi:MAG: transposase [Chitinophagaceae bacterium]|nr:transposase [Chitinophagaceae bacterium]